MSSLLLCVVHSGAGFVVLGPRQVVRILLSVFFQDPVVDRLLRVPGVLAFIEAHFVVETDIEKLGDKMIECIEAKRTALGI